MSITHTKLEFQPSGQVQGVGGARIRTRIFLDRPQDGIFQSINMFAEFRDRLGVRAYFLIGAERLSRSLVTDEDFSRTSSPLSISSRPPTTALTPGTGTAIKLCSTMGNVLNKPFHAMTRGDGED